MNGASAHRSKARGQLAVVATAMVLGMAPWFSATVAAPGMMLEWGTTGWVGTWLTIAVQLGFVVGTLISAVFLLSDRLSPRRLAAASCLLASVSTLALIWRHNSAYAALFLRALTGVALAGVYPPGIKLVAGWWRTSRGTAIGILVGALTVGSASPNLFKAFSIGANWRPIVVAAAVSALVSGALFAFLVREGPFQAPSAPFDPMALSRVLRDRGVMLATGGYLGHMWELYAMWSSIGAFWASVVSEHAASAAMAPILAFATIGVGTVGCVLAGLAADRIGRAVVTIIAMAVSGTCAITIGWLSTGPLALVVVVALVWGIAIVADSAQFSAAVTELAPADYVGTAITLQTCLGFLLTIVTIRLVPVWASTWGWQWAYVPLAIGPAAGILAMWRLRTAPGTGVERG